MNARELHALYGLTDADIKRIKDYGVAIAMPRLDDFIRELYGWMRTSLPDNVFANHFPDEKTLKRAQGSMRKAWTAFWSEGMDDGYLDASRRVGEIHAQLQVAPLHYLGTMHKASVLWTETFYDGSLGDAEYRGAVGSINRAIAMEGAMVIDVYTNRTADAIRQSRAILEMSTPITALWGGILMLPLVGFLDSRRAQDIMQRMLEQVAERQARVFILDISGVAVVDTAVANHLIRMTKAARLMGCATIVSGLSPQVAQTIVELGIEVGDMSTTGTLELALKRAFVLIGDKEHL